MKNTKPINMQLIYLHDYRSFFIRPSMHFHFAVVKICCSSPLISSSKSVFFNSRPTLVVEISSKRSLSNFYDAFSSPSSSSRSEEHTSELQSRPHLVCRLLLEKKK